MPLEEPVGKGIEVLRMMGNGLLRIILGIVPFGGVSRQNVQSGNVISKGAS